MMGRYLETSLTYQDTNGHTIDQSSLNDSVIFVRLSCQIGEKVLFCYNAHPTRINNETIVSS